MNKVDLYYKTDFSAILSFDGGWALPFRLNFYTGSPRSAFVAEHDGKGNYRNCHLESDGRLCIGFDHHNQPCGDMKLQPVFYLDNICYESGICDQEIEPFAPVFVDEDGEEYTLQLSMRGATTMTLIGTLPPFFQKGDKGDKGDPGRDGQDGQPGAKGDKGDKGDPGKDGKDGADGSILYPSVSIDAAGYLVAEIPDEAEGTNFSLDADGYLCVDFPDIK